MKSLKDVKVGETATVVKLHGEGATKRRIMDMGITDANNMGAAMAPAAADTLANFFADTATGPENYDLIVTGDLSAVGSDLLRELLEYHKARCGMSEVFRTIRLVSDAYVQTTVAVEIGRTLQQKGILVEETGGGRVFAYRDCYIYHLITACSEQVQLRSLCDEQLLAIREQDEQKSTDYANLLYTYLIKFA